MQQLALALPFPDVPAPPAKEDSPVPKAAPTTLPDDATLLLFSYAGTTKPPALRLAEVATRAAQRFGRPTPALVVPAAELAAYAAAWGAEDETIALLPSARLSAGHVAALDPR